MVRLPGPPVYAWPREPGQRANEKDTLVKTKYVGMATNLSVVCDKSHVHETVEGRPKNLKITLQSWGTRSLRSLWTRTADMFSMSFARWVAWAGFVPQSRTTLTQQAVPWCVVTVSGTCCGTPFLRIALLVPWRLSWD